MVFQKISRKFLVLIATIAFLFSGIPSSLAAEIYNYQNNQELNQPATLTAPSSDRPIKIYPQPDLSKSALGKAQKGDRVTVLQQIQGNQGEQWDYVKFEQEDQKEGWIQQDYVAIQNQQSNQKDQKPTQQSQSSSTYSQKEDYSNTQQSSKYQNKQQTYQTKQDYQKSQGDQRNQ